MGHDGRMRVLALLAALLVLAVVGWALFGQPENAPRYEPPPIPEAPSSDEPHRPVMRTGNLTIRVTAPDGSVPQGAEVGYVEPDGHVRLLYARENGARQFTDTPLGELDIVARAPGYEEVRAHRNLVAGVPEEVRLVVKPASD